MGQWECRQGVIRVGIGTSIVTFHLLPEDGRGNLDEARQQGLGHSYLQIGNAQESCVQTRSAGWFRAQ